MRFITPDWQAPLNIKAYTTLRSSWQGGLSRNFQQAEIDKLIDLLGLPTAPIWLYQNHTATVLEAHESNLNKEADALYTQTENRVCLIETADCIPVLLCDPVSKTVAAIHAGWRGMAAGIIEKTLQKLPQPSSQYLAWLGPGIGPEKFEVQADVYAAFTANSTASKAAFKLINNNKWLADLYQLARIRLNACGVTQVSGGQYCTYSQPELFYSYRRDKERNTGRMATVIWIHR